MLMMLRLPRATAFARSGALAMLLGVAGASGAGATEFCRVKTSNDGFAALRVAPARDAAIIAKMRPGEEVRVTGRRRQSWQYVHWWRGDTRIQRGVASPHARGWVHQSLIADCG